jgi:hypothetical protein
MAEAVAATSWQFLGWTGTAEMVAPLANMVESALAGGVLPILPGESAVVAASTSADLQVGWVAMMRGEHKVNASHLQRAAIVYVRQSTLVQVREHTESTARQYGWSTRRLGWAGRPAASR